MYKILWFTLLIPILNAQPKCLSVNILGSNKALNKTIYANLKNSTKSIKKSQNIIEDINVNIKRSLQTKGYFNTKIKSLLEEKNGCTQITSSIIIGNPTRFNDISLTCHPNKCAKSILSKIPAKKNKQFSSSLYNESLNMILQDAHIKGYIYANINQSKIMINPKKLSADVHYKLELNNLITISPPIIKNKVINKKLVYKIIDFKNNQPFSIDWLEKAQINLMNSGYFKDVDIDYKIKNNKAYLTLDLKPKTSSQKVLSVGYDTDTRLKSLFGIKIPVLNKHGHKLQITSTIGTKERNINFKYTLPGFEPNKENLAFSSYYENYLDLNFATVSFWTQSIIYSYISRSIMHNLSLNYKQEKSLYMGVDTTKSRLFYPEIQGYKKLSINTWYNKAQIKMKWLLRLANQQKPASSWFEQYLFQIQAKLPINKENHIVFSASHGKIITNDINNIPLSLQFSAGGGQSLRGYLYNELGPSDILNIANLELSHQLSGPWHLGAFIDNAYINSYWGKRWFHGIGLNLSWHSNLATIGVSIGQAISLPKHPFRIQLAVQI